jgi:hypothetical protein
VEPHALHGAEALAERHLEDGAGPSAEQHGAAHLSDDRGHGTGDQLGHGLRVEAVLVAKGNVVEQVLDGVDAARGETGGDALAHSLHELHRGREFQHTPMLSTSDWSWNEWMVV